METRYYVDMFGNYLGGFSVNNPSIPIGATEVITAPSDARQPWNGSSWENTIYTKWEEIRDVRQELFDKYSWRIERNTREIRLSITLTDNMVVLDQYFQDLADLPQIYTNPEDVIWPTEPSDPVV